MPIDRNVLVEDVMRDNPATIRVFLDFRLGCVGCAPSARAPAAKACVSSFRLSA